MKTLRLIFGIVVILALVCSPALAITKSEIITSYQDLNIPAKGFVPVRTCGNCSPPPTSIMLQADLIASYRDQNPKPYVYSYDNGTYISRTTGEVEDYNHDLAKSLESLPDWHTWITFDKQTVLNERIRFIKCCE